MARPFPLLCDHATYQENFSEFSARASLPFQTDGKSRRLPNDRRMAPSSDTSACALLLLVLGAEHTGCPQALSCTKPCYWLQETFPLSLQRGAGPSPDTRVTRPATAVVQGVWTCNCSRPRCHSAHLGQECARYNCRSVAGLLALQLS